MSRSTSQIGLESKCFRAFSSCETTSNHLRNLKSARKLPGREQAAWNIVKVPLDHYLLQDNPFPDLTSLSEFWLEIVKDRMRMEIHPSNDVLSLMTRHVQSFRSHLSESAREKITTIYGLPDDLSERRDKVSFLLSKDRFNCPEEHYEVCPFYQLATSANRSLKSSKL